MYQSLLKSLSKLLHSLSTTTNIDVLKASKAYKDYAIKVVTGYDYTIHYNVGDVCWVEFGNNLMPEMSYRHMALIVRRYDKMYYVIPITSISTSNRLMSNAYHPTENPTGNDSYFLLKAVEHSFLNHNSVLKMAEVKGVSVKRILSKNGTITAPLFEVIEKKYFSRFFPSKDREINLLVKNNSKLRMQLFLANLQDTYDVMDFNDFTNQLSVPSQYTVGNNAPVAISLNTYEYDLELIDEYGQRENKKIIYTIK